MSGESLFDSCTDACGWTAAVVALLAYGTYGVPIKETHKMPNLNPLVFQSYKSVVMFTMAPAVAMLGVPLRFTPWGILSGLLWVLGGTCGVVAVRWAGMATAVGTWASVMIFVNFVWGILVFEEPVANIYDTSAAFVLLTIGLVGMSKNSAPTSSHASRVELVEDHHHSSNSLLMNYSSFGKADFEKQANTETESLFSGCPAAILGRSASMDAKAFSSYRSDDSSENGFYFDDVPAFNPETHVQLLSDGMVLRKRTAGILAAVFNGLMSGSSLIPLHYAERDGFGGPHYMISYATGAAIANIGLWVVYYIVLVMEVHEQTSSQDAYLPLSWSVKLRQAAANMPEWHFHQLWKPGLAAGTYGMGFPAFAVAYTLVVNRTSLNVNSSTFSLKASCYPQLCLEALCL
jgi:Transmembrane family, TMEM144 of transporters